jgi:hypothetical protein
LEDEVKVNVLLILGDVLSIQEWVGVLAIF